jgi:Na+/H+ antiporter NhaD/arsenite permease-like protein
MQRNEDSNAVVMGYRAVASLTAIMVLLQPILAGQFVYGGEADMKDVHAVVGQSLHLTVLAQLILAFLARRTFGIGLAIFNLVLLVLISVQAGIGFSDDGDIIAIHIPLGTVLLVLAMFAAFLAFFDLRRQRRSAAEGAGRAQPDGAAVN